MRNKKLWKNMMLATACTVALGTASVPVLAAEVNTETGLSVEAETVPDAQPTPDAQVEADTQTPTDVKGELTGIDFTTAEGGVVTVTDADFNSGVVAIPYVLHGTPYDGGLDNGVYFDVISSGDFGIDNPQDLDGNGNYEGAFYANKDALVAEGGTKTYSGTFKMMDTEQDIVDDTLDFSITVKYVPDESGNGGDNGNGGTETPDPDNGNGNGGTETPDPDNGNGNGDNNNGGDNGNTETPDGNGDNNTETPDGNNGNNTDNEQKPITGQTVKPATKTESTSPKTGDMSAVLPVLGTGITSLGVAVAALFRKRK